ncbi:MAG: tetratricopeptide repeat protein [Rhodospirillales bacterium]|nr:tetratricopeptide repeat protein [Rhodospirillales bacterium]
MTDDPDYEAYLDTLQEIIDLQSAGDLTGAVNLISSNLAKYADKPEMLLLTAVCSYRQNNAGQAIELCEQAHKIDPENQEVVDSLAVLKVITGSVSDGLYYAKLATTLSPHPYLPDLLPPDFSNFFHALRTAAPSRHFLDGLYLFNGRQFNDAAKEFRAELSLNPGNADAVKKLGHALIYIGEQDEAIKTLAVYGDAHADDPDVPSLMALANCRLGNFDEAARLCREAAALAPESLDNLMRILETAQFFEGELAAVYKEITAAAAVIIGKKAEDAATDEEYRPKDFDEPISIAMISNSLHGGDQHTFLLPMIENIDKRAFELTVFQQSPTGGPAFQEFKSKSPNWRRIVDVDDEVLAMILTRQRTDILIDLCGFSTNGRAVVSAASVAPVVTSLLHEPYGLKAPGVNVIISDAATADVDARNLGDGQRIVRTEGGLFALRPIVLMGDVGPLPAHANGHVTFGAQCSAQHISPSTVRMWSGILNAVDGSRLVLGNTANISNALREKIHAKFADAGVADKIDFQQSITADSPDSSFFNGIDIFLDSTPVNGTMTLCQALWMGVPVITAKADRRSGVIGASILTSAGQSDWIGEDVDDAIRIAVALTGDLDALSVKRENLRDATNASALMDVTGNSKKMYAALKSALESVRN